MVRTNRTCSIEDCTGPAVTRGWCSAHYQRWYRATCIVDGCDRVRASREAPYCYQHRYAGAAPLELALQRQPLGTHMAGAYVNEDGTATVHLLERINPGWLNLTTEDRLSSADMERLYDDVVLF